MSKAVEVIDVVGKVYGTNTSYTWIIDDFHAISRNKNFDERVSSPEFWISNNNVKSQWRLCMYPYGHGDNNKSVDESERGRYASVFIDHLSGSITHANVTFCIINKKNKIVLKAETARRNFKKCPSWGFHKFVVRNDLNDKAKNWLTDGRLTIMCEIKTDISDCVAGQNNDTQREMRLHEFNKFEKLLDSENFSDVIFNVDGKQFHAHKNILANQSSVFAAMFKHEMMEKQCNVVEIKDISYEVLREMFRFVYAGKINEIEKFVNDLLAAAEKYCLEGLKTVCEKFLCDNLTIDNALDCMKLADTYNADKLRAQAIEFILSNVRNIIDEPEFEAYSRSNSDTLLKLFRTLVLKKLE